MVKDVVCACPHLLCPPSIFPQVLSPALAARARIFHSRLALKPEWVRIDSSYFDAAGSLLAPLTPMDRVPPPGLGTQRITMVFSTVDGGKGEPVLRPLLASEV